MGEDVAGRLGANVRALREARGLTQARIAELAGVPRPTWATLESGAANPTLAVMMKVANALQVRLEERGTTGPPSSRSETGGKSRSGDYSRRPWPASKSSA